MKSILPLCALSLFVLAGHLFAAAPPAGPDPILVSHLVDQLDDEDFFVRQKADDQLRAMGKAVLALLQAERGRTASLEARHRIGMISDALTTSERIVGWVRQLGHANPQLREQADRALRQSGPRVLPVLKQELKSGLDGQCRVELEKLIAELSGVRR